MFQKILISRHLVCKIKSILYESKSLQKYSKILHNIPKFYLDNRWKFKGISIGTFRFKLNATSLKMHQDKCAFQTLLFSNAPSICEFKSSAISRRKLLITVFVPEKSLALAWKAEKILILKIHLVAFKMKNAFHLSHVTIFLF